MIKSNQNGFTKRKPCLNNFTTLFDGRTGWIEEGSTVEAVYLDSSKFFDTVFPEIGEVCESCLDIFLNNIL